MAYDKFILKNLRFYKVPTASIPSRWEILQLLQK